MIEEKVKKKNTTIRESNIESKCCKYAKTIGFNPYKMLTPNNRGFPDRMFYGQGKVFFVEFKSPTGKPTKLQSLRIKHLQDEKFDVYIVNNIEDFKKICSYQLQK